MNVFLAGTEVQYVVQLNDDDGNPLDVDSIQYRITDPAGVEIVALSSLSSFVSLEPTATIIVSAANNALATNAARSLRSIELHCVVAGNTVVRYAYYVIERAVSLTVGVNTFQSLTQAEFNATVMPNLPGWNAATNPQKIAALVDARLHICQLNFEPLSNNRYWGQNSLNFIPEGTYDTNTVGRDTNYLWGGSLADVPASQFVKLPVIFLEALNLAQLAEADKILGGDPMDAKRSSGLVLDTIGESKQMFRVSRPLDLPVCRRALGYLASYVTFSRRIARG